MSERATPVVLVVDDSAVMRGAVCSTLQEMGLASREAQDGAEAWRLMREDRFDLIVTDLHMPLVDGLKLIKLVRGGGAHREVGIIVVSAEGTEADLRRAVELGANAVLKKPFERPQLAAAVARLLRA